MRTCRVLGRPDRRRLLRGGPRRAPRARGRRGGRDRAGGGAALLPVDRRARSARRGATGADAIHPGYGFLSQNGDFADAVRDAGLVFVGPPGDVHRLMGDKQAARRHDGGGRRPGAARLRRRRPAGRDARWPRPQRIGWPLHAQALARRRRQGHARGARRGRASPARSRPRGARRSAAFGDDALVLERFVERPRHVEVQVIADAHGADAAPRRARVLGAAPPPEGGRGDAEPGASTPAAREALCAAGVAAARAAGYRERGHRRVPARAGRRASTSSR